MTLRLNCPLLHQFCLIFDSISYLIRIVFLQLHHSWQIDPAFPGGNWKSTFQSFLQPHLILRHKYLSGHLPLQNERITSTKQPYRFDIAEEVFGKFLTEPYQDAAHSQSHQFPPVSWQGIALTKFAPV